MAAKKGGRRSYATDLTDGQWELIAPFIPERSPVGDRARGPGGNL